MRSGKEPEEPHATFPNKFEAFYLVAVLITIEILLTFALRDSSLLADVDWQGTSGFVTVVGNGVLFVFLLTYKKMSYRSLFHPAGHSAAGMLGRLVLPIVLILPGLLFLTGALNAVVIWLFPMSNEELEAFSDMMTASAMPLFFSCIAAPLLEEMLFRGIVLRSFLQQYSRLHAIVWTAVIFAIAHLNPYQFFTALILGLALGWLYERTRSLWPAICLHAAFNGLVTYSANSNPADLGYSFAWLIGAAFVCAIAGGGMLVRMLEPAVTRKRSERGPKS